MENYGNYQSNNYEGYDDLRMFPDEAPIVTAVKGLVGAIVGAIPGMLVWIILGKMGYIAVLCGILLAFGSVFGYNFMTKKGNLSLGIGVGICIAVLVIAVFFAEKIVWCWELTDIFNEMIPQWRAEISSLAAEYGDVMSAAEIENLFEELMLEEYGFIEADFSTCFYNFGDLIETLEVKSDFTISLVKSYVCGVAGAAVSFKYFK
ncbi:MAG: hypothetical protein E7497_06525 [Ruminococcus sp.]|nr:hypothetical protein [Ruminococcus sp.]